MKVQGQKAIKVFVLLMALWASLRASNADDLNLGETLSRDQMVAAVSEYIRQSTDAAIDSPKPELYELRRKFGAEAVVMELARETEARQSGYRQDVLLQNILSSDHPFAGLAPLALKTAKDVNGWAPERAAYWLARYRDFLDVEQLKEARKIIFERYVSSGGKKNFDAVSIIAVRSDIPILRTIYDRQFPEKRVPPGVSSLTRIALQSFNGSATTNALSMHLLLARLGEPKAVHRIEQALKQADDPWERGWGLMMVDKLKDASWLVHVAPLLEDDRQIPVVLDDYRVEDKPQPYRIERVYKTVRTLATEVAYNLLGRPKEGWPFQPNHPDYLSLHGYARKVYPLEAPLGDAAWSETERVFVRDHIVRYTEDQHAFIVKWVQSSLAQQNVKATDTD